MDSMGGRSLTMLSTVERTSSAMNFGGRRSHVSGGVRDAVMLPWSSPDASGSRTNSSSIPGIHIVKCLLVGCKRHTPFVYVPLAVSALMCALSLSMGPLRLLLQWCKVPTVRQFQFVHTRVPFFVA